MFPAVPGECILNKQSSKCAESVGINLFLCFQPHSWFLFLKTVFVSVFVLSLLDYCNSLLSGCPQYLLQSSKQTLLPLSCEFPKLNMYLLILLLSTGCPLTDEYSTLASLCCICLNSTAPVYLTEPTVSKQPASYAFVLILPLILCLPSVRSHSLG